MKIILFILISLIPLFGFSQSQIRVNYFGDIQFEKGKQELVIITHAPQTEFAENFGARIYTDDAFFKTIHETFYTMVDPEQEQIINMCGFDIFFYLKTGPNLKLIKYVNSQCSHEQLSFLTQLANQGEPLVKDSLYRKDLSNNLHKNVSNGVVMISYPDLLFYLPEKTLFNNGVNFPLSFYDGLFTVKLTSPEAILIKNHLNNFIQTHFDSAIEDKLINWQINTFNGKKWRPNLSDYLYENFKTTDLTVTFYLSKKLFPLFKDQEITPIHSEAERQGPWIVYRTSN